MGARSRITDSPEWFNSLVYPTAIMGRCLVHDSVVRAARIQERVSLKRCCVHTGAEINTGSYLESVTVEEDVQIGPNCSIVGVWHPYDAAGVRKELVVKPITLKRGCLLGAGVIVVPGVTIGEGSVVGAGTKVTRDVPPHHICDGRRPHQLMMPLSLYEMCGSLRKGAWYDKVWATYMRRLHTS